MFYLIRKFFMTKPQNLCDVSIYHYDINQDPANSGSQALPGTLQDLKCVIFSETFVNSFTVIVNKKKYEIYIIFDDIPENIDEIIREKMPCSLFFQVFEKELSIDFKK